MSDSQQNDVILKTIRGLVDALDTYWEYSDKRPSDDKMEQHGRYGLQLRIIYALGVDTVCAWLELHKSPAHAEALRQRFRRVCEAAEIADDQASTDQADDAKESLADEVMDFSLYLEEMQRAIAGSSGTGYGKGERVGPEPDAMLACDALAKTYGVDCEQLRKRLERRRKHDQSSWFTTIETRMQGEPKFLYKVQAVLPIIDKLKSSAKRP
jgi:hypothetical protein